MASGKGTKSDFDKVRYDLFPPPEFMLDAMNVANDNVQEMLRAAYEFWAGDNPASLLLAIKACERAMGLAGKVHPSPAFIEVLGRIATMGAQKYSDRNWENGMKWGRVFRAFLNHTFAYLRGEVTDPESGEPHLAHAGWNLVALYTYAMRGTGDDSRYKAAA